MSIPVPLQRYWTGRGMTNADVTSCELRKWGKGHVYEAKLRSGKTIRLKSVTSVLGIINKPALVPWAANEAGRWVAENLQVGTTITDATLQWIVEECRKEHWRTRDKAATLGTLAHNFIERWLRGEDIQADLEQADPQVQNCVALFWDFWRTEQLQVVEVELVVYDVALGYAGKLDFLAMKPDGTIWLLDWKTGNSIYPEMLLQVIAYLHALLRSYPKPIQVSAVSILRIGKNDADFEREDIPVNQWADLFWLFQCSHMLCSWHKDEEAKRERERKARWKQQQLEREGRTVDGEYAEAPESVPDSFWNGGDWDERGAA